MAITSCAADVIEKRSFNESLADIWRYRELLYFFIWRDVKVRYKQTVVGGLWAILQPLITMVIFAVVFGAFAKIPSDGIPYPVFAYTALVPWTYFAQALNRSGTSLVYESSLITKVYFPRLMIPFAAVISPLVEFSLSFVILLCLNLWYGVGLTWWILTVPAFLFVACMTALAIGLWLSALNVKYRDVAYTLPFLCQIWMYTSPVVYPASMVPDRWRLLYSLNPMAGVIEGFRWALLGQARPDLFVMMVSSTVVLALLLSGILFFKKMELTFADVI
jgi:lipopolysaccharide transport system permease protein